MHNTHVLRARTQWDYFIPHAVEDRDEIVRPLADALNATGLLGWYLDYALKQGDDLCQLIDYGLARSRFGVVVLSVNFFKKQWRQEVLNDLATHEVDGNKVILPVWHGVGFRDVFEYSPVLADRGAISTDKGINYVVEWLAEACSPRA
jgi:hypothetical protein